VLRRLSSDPAEGKAFASAARNDTVAAWREFLNAWPRGWREVEARSALEAAEERERKEAEVGDLENLQRGAALTVDVSCPKCGHINVSQKARSCETCQEDLVAAHIFRPCPGCSLLLLRDVSPCPDCSADVATHYRLLDALPAVDIQHCNFANIIHGPSEFVVDFGRMTGSSTVMVFFRGCFIPGEAKRLLLKLRAAVSQHEKENRT
jgi:hypothetical protein